jgi:hypothetical protein
MLKLFYSFILTTTFINCKAQTTDDFQQNINEMNHYKAILANDDDFDSIQNKLIFDITGGIKQIKINEKVVDSLGFTKIISTFLNTNKNKKSLLIAGSFDHATIDNIVVFTRLFNQCKLLSDPNNKSKIYFKSFKDFNSFQLKTANLNNND